MIVQMPSQEVLKEWKSLWKCYKDTLQPNRKNGPELLQYLQSNYCLTEIFEDNILNTISENVTNSPYWSDKLPEGSSPFPKAYYLENHGNGKKFYLPENQDPIDLWGGVITRIFVAIDLSSGFYTVEGSTLLWEELCAFQGVDENDLKNYVIVAQYIHALRRLDAEKNGESCLL